MSYHIANDYHTANDNAVPLSRSLTPLLHLSRFNYLFVSLIVSSGVCPASIEVAKYMKHVN